MVPQPVTPGTTEALIPRFYAGRDIFITGGTGFMGKVLVERLLSTCPEVGRLHLLMRDKKGQPPSKRLVQLKQSQIFDNLRLQNPRQLDKLTVVSGDVSQPHLGLDIEAIAALKEVSIVFHAAATLKFDEPLPKGMQQNVRSVERVLDLCDQLPKIEAFIYVSTAYSNANLAVVEERVYPPPKPLEQFYAMVDAVPEELLANITQQYISPKPNTYTFTKALAEHVVQEHGNQGYPVAIVRPTVVVSSLQHPFPGWVDNLNGPCGVVVGAGKGLLHVIALKDSARADLLPVDIAIDTLIAVAWEIAVDRPTQVRVYNCSTCDNPTTWYDFRVAMRKNLHIHPLDNSFWYPCGYCVENKFAYKILGTILETIPLHMAEYITKILGVKTRLSLILINQRFKAMNDVLRFFSTREWYFQTDNTRQLQDRLSPQDSAIYNLDPHSIVWEELYENFVIGTRKYLLMEKEQDIEGAKKHSQKMFYVHYGTLLFVLTLVCRLSLHNQYIKAFVYRTFRMLVFLLNITYSRLKSSYENILKVGSLFL